MKKFIELLGCKVVGVDETSCINMVTLEVEKPNGSKVLVQLGGEVKMRVGAGEILGPSIEAFDGNSFELAFKNENEEGVSFGYVCNDVLVDLQVPERLFHKDNKMKPLSDKSRVPKTILGGSDPIVLG